MAKCLAIIVALVLTTGSQANDSGEASKPNITVELLMNPAVEVVMNIPFVIAWSSFRIFDTKTSHALYEIFGNISRRFDRFDKELSPDLVETYKLVTNVLKGILVKASNPLHELQRKKAFTRPLIPILSHYFDPVLERASPQLYAFEDTFRGWMRELSDIYHKWLPQKIQGLESEFAFYLEELEDVKVTLQPMADQAMTRLRQGLEALLKNLKPQLKRFLEENQGFNEEFKQWVKTPIFPRDP